MIGNKRQPITAQIRQQLLATLTTRSAATSLEKKSVQTVSPLIVQSRTVSGCPLFFMRVSHLSCPMGGLVFQWENSPTGRQDGCVLKLAQNAAGNFSAHERAWRAIHSASILMFPPRSSALDRIVAIWLTVLSRPSADRRPSPDPHARI